MRTSVRRCHTNVTDKALNSLLDDTPYLAVDQTEVREVRFG